MTTGDDDLLGPKPLRRSRRLIPVVAIVTPVLLFAGGAAWFIRSYVAPPVFKVPEPLMTAALDTATPLLPFDQRAASMAPEPAAPPRPVMTLASASPLSPFSRPPVAPAPPAYGAMTDAEPISGRIPLPTPRPRISTAQIRGPVPMPRPRPTN
jgi:hypothetical protein